MKSAPFHFAWMIVAGLAACSTSTDARQEKSVDVLFVEDVRTFAAKPEEVGKPELDVEAASLEEYIAHVQDEHEFPGIAAAVVGPDGIWWEGTFGYADQEDARVVDRDTLFLLASVSKLFVGAAVMRLVEDGFLDLDRPIDDYLGYPVINPHAPETPITTRMLLAHVSGVEDSLDKLAATINWNGDSEVTLERFTSGYLTQDGEFYSPNNFGAAPLEAREYSNAAFGVLGQIIECAGGRSFPEFVETEIFAPLQITDSAWRLADLDLNQVAVPYFGGPTDHGGWGFYPATSLRMSVSELGRFFQLFMNDGTLDGATVLAPSSIESSWTLQYPELSPRQGLAWYKNTVGEQEFWYHGGEALGSSTAAGIRSDRAFGIILLTNSSAHLRETIGLREDEAAAFRKILEKLAARGEELSLHR